MPKIYEALLQLTESSFPSLESLSPEQLYLMGCKKFGQYCATLRALLEPERYCPFCADGQRSEPVLYSTADWYLRTNDFPKKNMKMLLILPKRHLQDSAELTFDDWAQIGEIFARACQDHGFLGGGFVMRFGAPMYHAGTIPHLHINLIQPNPYEEYKIPLSKSLHGREENYMRLLAHRYALEFRGGLSWLFSKECNALIESETEQV